MIGPNNNIITTYTHTYMLYERVQRTHMCRVDNDGLYTKLQRFPATSPRIFFNHPRAVATTHEAFDTGARPLISFTIIARWYYSLQQICWLQGEKTKQNKKPLVTFNSR